MDRENADNAGNVGLKRVIHVKRWTGKRKIPKLFGIVVKWEKFIFLLFIVFYGHIGMLEWRLNLKVNLGHGFVIFAEMIRRVSNSLIIIKIV